MDESLANRLKIAFPAGVDWEPDVSALDANDQGARIRKALSVFGADVHIEPSFGDTLLKSYTITLSSNPEFSAWLWSYGNKDKIEWIRRNNSYYVVLWLKISRVADYYMYFFNHWHPRGETGYLDADFRIEPDANWSARLKMLTASLEHNGFQHATREVTCEPVDFVRTYGGDAIPEDDPRWDDPEFEPPPVKARVYDCLFGDQ